MKRKEEPRREGRRIELNDSVENSRARTNRARDSDGWICVVGAHFVRARGRRTRAPRRAPPSASSSPSRPPPPRARRVVRRTRTGAKGRRLKTSNVGVVVVMSAPAGAD
eukprot:23955-Pelagococcus_subviridis.AAC.1